MEGYNSLPCSARWSAYIRLLPIKEADRTPILEEPGMGCFNHRPYALLQEDVDNPKVPPPSNHLKGRPEANIVRILSGRAALYLRDTDMKLYFPPRGIRRTSLDRGLVGPAHNGKRCRVHRRKRHAIFSCIANSCCLGIWLDTVSSRCRDRRDIRACAIFRC